MTSAYMVPMIPIGNITAIPSSNRKSVESERCGTRPPGVSRSAPWPSPGSTTLQPQVHDGLASLLSQSTRLFFFVGAGFQPSTGSADGSPPGYDRVRGPYQSVIRCHASSKSLLVPQPFILATFVTSPSLFGVGRAWRHGAHCGRRPVPLEFETDLDRPGFSTSRCEAVKTFLSKV